MSNIIGLNTKLFGLEKNIKQSEPTRAANDLGQLGDPTEKERVLNPIVSESYMQKYVEEHGGGGGSLEPVTLLDVTVTSANDGNNYVINLYNENYNPLYSGLYIPTSLMGLTFIYDNTEYNCENIDYEYGAPYIDVDTYDFSDYPFNYKSGSYYFICDDNEPTSHTIKIIMKPSIEKITITNSMAYDIPLSQSDAQGNNSPSYILANGNDAEQYDVLLYSGYGQLYNYSYNGNPVIFSNLVNCHLDSFGQKLIITPNCSFTISQEDPLD